MIRNKTSLTPAPADSSPKGSFPDLRQMTGERVCAYGVGMIKNEITLTPAALGNINPPQKEWGRWRDVQNSYGLKRGLLHLLCAEGKIRSVLIVRRGNIHGTRYYLMSSVSDYLHSLLPAQEKKAAD